jgi:maltose O-acetyltransferase
VWWRPFLDVQGKLIVGERVQFISTRAQLEILVEAQGTLEIGDDTIINYGTSICATRHVRIGRGALVGMHAIIMDTDYHRLDPLHRQERPESLPIVLEENVWLAARVVVLRGVTIGANSVIGAGSVVTKDIPPNVFAAGLPARVIKHL